MPPTPPPPQWASASWDSKARWQQEPEQIPSWKTAQQPEQAKTTSWKGSEGPSGWESSQPKVVLPNWNTDTSGSDKHYIEYDLPKGWSPDDTHYHTTRMFGFQLLKKIKDTTFTHDSGLAGKDILKAPLHAFMAKGLEAWPLRLAAAGLKPFVVMDGSVHFRRCDVGTNQ